MSKKLTMVEARKLYSIRGNSTITNWIRKKQHLEDELIMATQINNRKTTNERILELEKQLAEKSKALYLAESKAHIMEKMVDLAEKEFKIKIKKNFGSELLKQSTNQTP